MSHVKLSVGLVFLANGLIDKAGSMLAFEEALNLYEAERVLEQDTIAQAVDSVFDKYPGVAITMPALTTNVLGLLNATPATHAVLSEKIGAYIRENSDRPKVTDRKTKAVLQEAEPARTRKFGIKKGHGGGVCRWSDVPLSET